MQQDMKEYLEALITEKGANLDDNILEGHIGLDYHSLIEFIERMPEHHPQIRKTLVMIDFKNGDVFHYLKFLAEGMVEAMGMNNSIFV